MDKKKIDTKKILLIGLPVVLVLLFSFVFLKQKKEETVKDATTVQKTEALVPDAEEETPLSKEEVYKNEKEQTLKERNENNAVYSDADFFGNDVKSTQQQTTITADELYAKTVQNKPITTPTIPRRKTVSISSPHTTQGIVKTKSKGNTYVRKEKSKIDELYDAATTEETPTYHTQPTTQQQVIAAQVVSGANGVRKRTKNGATAAAQKNLVTACIHGDQKVSSGSPVRMRLLEDLRIDNIIIPKNTIFYGIAKIGGERLSISVNSIKYNNYIANVNYTVYDNDAIQGLNLPENIKNELLKQSTSSGVSNIELPTASGTVGDIITSTASVVKGVTTSSIKELKVSLKSNYKIFIK